MSPTSYPRPDGANSIVGGYVEVFLDRISWNSVGAGLQWIYLDPTFVRLCWCGSRFDLFDLQLSSSAMVAALVRWSFGALAR